MNQFPNKVKRAYINKVLFETDQRENSPHIFDCVTVYHTASKIYL